MSNLKLLLVVAASILVSSKTTYGQADAQCYSNVIINPPYEGREEAPMPWTCFGDVIGEVQPTATLLDIDFLEYNASTGTMQPLTVINKYYIYLIIHDYHGSSKDTWVKNMAQNLYQRAMQDHPLGQNPSWMDGVHIVVLDWTRAAAPSSNYLNRIRYAYTQAVKNALLVSQFVGNHMNDLITDHYRNPNSPFAHVHCLGHGVGAHICGVSSEVFKNGRPFWKPYNRITALDPARVLFEDSDDGFQVHNTEKLDKSDAYFVDAIHTTSVYGFNGRAGLVDHYVNNEYYSGYGNSPVQITQLQPGCSTYFCSHLRSVEIFISTIPRLISSQSNCNFLACQTSHYPATCRLGFDANNGCDFHSPAFFCGAVAQPYEPYCY